MKFDRNRTWLMAGTAFALLSTVTAIVAHAQTATVAADDAETLKKKKAAAAVGASYLSPVTVTASRNGIADPYATPAAVSSVSSDQVDVFGQRNVGDVLRSLPGTFSRDSIQNAGLSINIRGFEGSGRVNTMIDGVRQDFRFTGHEAQGFAYVDPALVAGVDVTRGSVSTVGGAGALAGSANIRTLGVDDILQDGKNWGALASLTWGSNNIGFSEMAAGAIRSPGGGAAIAGAISYHDQGDYGNADGTTVPYTGQNLLSGLAKADFAPTDDLTVNFGGVWYNNDFAANSYNQNVKSNTYTSGFNWDPDGDLVNLSGHVYYNDVTMTYDSPITTGSYAGRVIEDQGAGFDLSNISEFKLGRVDVSSTYGVEYFHDDVDASNTVDPTKAGGVNPSGTSSVGGVFSETKFSYGMVDVIGGLRYDAYTLDGTFNAKAGNPAGVPVGDYDLDQSEGRLDPKLTLALNPLDWFQPYVTYSESFRPPTIQETMAGGSHPGGGIGFGPNPFLVPETQKGWEVGFNVKKDGWLTEKDSLRIKADYFYQNIDNYITGVVLPAGPPAYYAAYFANTPGTSVVQGFEAEMAYDAGFAFGSVSYTHTDTDLPSQVNGFGAVSFLPDESATLTAGARFLEQRLTIGGRVSYVGRTSVGGAVNAGYSDWAPYTLVDAFSNYKMDSGLDLSASVTNLFNESYIPALSNIASAPAGLITGRGRTVMLTAKMQF